MGRYYYGDIDGKFWFAVQDSTAADRFGATYFEPSTINYWFDEGHLESVEKELKAIEDSLGKKKEILDEFFSRSRGYTDQEIRDMGISEKELMDYADYGLGIKIRDCIKERGQCQFEAEI